MKGGLIAGLSLAAAFAAGASLVHPDLDLSVSADFRSAYISSNGGVVETQPVTSQCLDWAWRMGEYGRFEGYAWIVSALTGQKDDFRRREFNEFETEISYAYDWKFADGWSFDNQLGHIWDAEISPPDKRESYHNLDAEERGEIEDVHRRPDRLLGFDHHARAGSEQEQERLPAQESTGHGPAPHRSLKRPAREGGFRLWRTSGEIFG